MIRQSTATLPEPHEGATGIDRADDPLLASGETKLIIARLTRHLWQANLARSPSSVFYDLYGRMTNPRPGDPVVVIDIVMSNNPEYHDHGVGYLVLSRTEWCETHAEWTRLKAEEGYSDDDRTSEREVWYVQYGPAPADVCRWVNCQVVTIPNTATADQFVKE